ncbi:MAG: hypothetical protein AB1515_05015 [Nitrospirota bacterium]
MAPTILKRNSNGAWGILVGLAFAVPVGLLQPSDVSAAPQLAVLTKAEQYQENLGAAIVQTAQKVHLKRLQFKKSIATAARGLRDFTDNRAGRWQERLGRAVVAAYQQAPEGGDAFQSAYRDEVSRLIVEEARATQEREAELQRLITEEVEYHRDLPRLYQEAIRLVPPQVS